MDWSGCWPQSKARSNRADHGQDCLIQTCQSPGLRSDRVHRLGIAPAGKDRPVVQDPVIPAAMSGTQCLNFSNMKRDRLTSFVVRPRFASLAHAVFMHGEKARTCRRLTSPREAVFRVVLIFHQTSLPESDRLWPCTDPQSWVACHILSFSDLFSSVTMARGDMHLHHIKTTSRRIHKPRNPLQ
jgi:hypothetical protein